LYPEGFGEKERTKIALAIDKARGGFFDKVPKITPRMYRIHIMINILVIALYDL
jgi:hypothetical protein|tara:strand:- start:316 stop:477 length:162 start_codon:yes stop_codon:yes gene_type:complete